MTCQVGQFCQVESVLRNENSYGNDNLTPQKNNIYISILLDVLVCSIAEYFYKLCCILTSPSGLINNNYYYYYLPKRANK